MTSSTAHTPSTAMSRFQLGVIKATALLFGLGLGLAAQAAGPRGEAGVDAATHRDCRSDDGANRTWSGPGAKDSQHRLENLHQQLSLSPAQDDLWKKATSGTDKLREEMQAEQRSRRDKVKALLDSKNPDLRALTSEMDRDRDARQQKHKAAREEWLKLYDALSSEQKQKASQFLLGQMGMMPMGGMGHMGQTERERAPRHM